MARQVLLSKKSHKAFLAARRAYYAEHYRKHPEKLARKREMCRLWHKENYRLRKRQKYESEHPCARCGHAREHTNYLGRPGPCSHGRSLEEQLAASEGEALFDKAYFARLRAIECPCPAHI